MPGSSRDSPGSGITLSHSVHAPQARYPSDIHHRARRRLAHGRADGGHHRERGRVLQRELGPLIWPTRARPALTPRQKVAGTRTAGKQSTEPLRRLRPLLAVAGGPCKTRTIVHSLNTDKYIALPPDHLQPDHDFARVWPRRPGELKRPNRLAERKPVRH